MEAIWERVCIKTKIFYPKEDLTLIQLTCHSINKLLLYHISFCKSALCDLLACVFVISSSGFSRLMILHLLIVGSS